MRGTPWQPFEDAAGDVLRLFSAENAMTGVNAMDTSGAAIETIGKAWQAVGRQIADEIDWEPRVAGLFEKVGESIIRLAGPTRDAAAAVRRAEDERIRNVEDGSAKRRKWDIGAHD